MLEQRACRANVGAGAAEHHGGARPVQARALGAAIRKRRGFSTLQKDVRILSVLGATVRDLPRFDMCSNRIDLLAAVLHE